MRGYWVGDKAEKEEMEKMAKEDIVHVLVSEWILMAGIVGEWLKVLHTPGFRDL